MHFEQKSSKSDLTSAAVCFMLKKTVVQRFCQKGAQWFHARQSPINSQPLKKPNRKTAAEHNP